MMVLWRFKEADGLEYSCKAEISFKLSVSLVEVGCFALLGIWCWFLLVKRVSARIDRPPLLVEPFVRPLEHANDTESIKNLEAASISNSSYLKQPFLDII